MTKVLYTHDGHPLFRLGDMASNAIIEVFVLLMLLIIIHVDST